MTAAEKKERNERRTFLSLVAYGVHSEYQKKLRRKIEEEFGFKSFFIYEYFWDHPILKGVSQDSLSGFAPFLLRILNESRFVPKFPTGFPKEFPSDWKQIEKLEYTYENVIEFWNGHSKGSECLNPILGKKIQELWESDSDKVGVDSPEPLTGTIWKEERSSILKGDFSYPISYLQKDYLEYLNTLAGYDKTSKAGLLKEYMISVLPWLHCNSDKILKMAAVSISSKHIFYGYILIFYLQDKAKKINIFLDANGNESKSIRELKNFIAETYIPVLALCENYWNETKLDDLLKLNRSKKIKWEKYSFTSEILTGSLDNIERGLNALWSARKKLWSKKKEKIKKSLHLSKYFIASSGMVKEVKNVILPRNLPPKNTGKDHIPCVLVIGDPGSGKDTIAKIVSLFFPEYRFGKNHIINMASLKPDTLSVPLLGGFKGDLLSGKINFGGGDVNIDLKSSLKGLFSMIWSEFKREHPGKDGLEEARKKGEMPVVILDELNSLNVDAQGSLLRILQNAELQALGAVSPLEKEKKVNFLVIGIVNEPEDTLTLEKPLRQFLTDKEVFGGVTGKALYDHFRNIRRLREDLYYRLVREGRIKLPELAERRPDIPILFSFFVKEELTNEIGKGLRWDNLWFDFDVFEELMAESISWNGNVRQLQSFARRTSNNILHDPDPNQRKVIDDMKTGTFNESFIHISLKHITDIMKEFFGKDI